jgi:hypothetical protein
MLVCYTETAASEYSHNFVGALMQRHTGGRASRDIVSLCSSISERKFDWELVVGFIGRRRVQRK